MRACGGLLVAAAIAGTAPAVTAADVDLAGTTTIQGATTAAEPVRLTRPATVALEATESVELEGGGDFAGFVLIAEGTDATRPFLVGGRQEGPFGALPFLVSPNLDIDNGEYTIPAGDYRLYLIGDGVPVAVTLKLGGLDGAIAFTPTRPVRSTLRRPPRRGLPQGASSAGDRATLGGPGLLFGLLTTRYDQVVADNTSNCYYLGDESAASPTAFTPGCADADIRTNCLNVRLDVGAAGFRCAGFIVSEGAGGVFGQGYSITTAGLVSDLSYDALWLDFDQRPRDGLVAPADPPAPRAPAPQDQPPPRPDQEQPGPARPAPPGSDPQSPTAGRGSGADDDRASTPAARRRLSVRRVSRRSALRSGIRATVTGVDGRVRLRATSGGRTIATGTAIARRGRAQIVLRPTSAGRRLLRGARRTTTVTVTGARLSRRIQLR